MTQLSPEVNALLRRARVATGQRLSLCAITLVAGCSFDAYPSLGWDKHTGRDFEDAATAADADTIDAAGEVPDAGVETTDAGGLSIECPTGLYIGDFTCSVEAVGFVSTMQIRFILEQASSGTPEATTSMPIFGSASSGLLLADFDARLDCRTGAFHADLTNGFALLGPIPVIAPFEGVIDGQVDEEVGILGGTWRMYTPQGTPLSTLATCDGEWSAPLPR